MAGARVQGIACLWCDIGNCSGDHVIVMLGGWYVVPWVFKMGRSWFFCFSIPFNSMSLSDQHPYALFVAGGLRSPSLAKARVEVGGNTNAYLVSADIASF